LTDHLGPVARIRPRSASILVVKKAVPPDLKKIAFSGAPEFLPSKVCNTIHQRCGRVASIAESNEYGKLTALGRDRCFANFRNIEALRGRAFFKRVALRGTRSNRSIVEALIARILWRIGSARCKCPLRSKAGNRIGNSARRRFPHTRSEASQRMINALVCRRVIAMANPALELSPCLQHHHRRTHGKPPKARGRG